MAERLRAAIGEGLKLTPLDNGDTYMLDTGLEAQFYEVLKDEKKAVLRSMLNIGGEMGEEEEMPDLDVRSYLSQLIAEILRNVGV